MCKSWPCGERRRFMCLSEITFVKSFVKLHNRIRAVLTGCQAQLLVVVEDLKRRQKADCQWFEVNIIKTKKTYLHLIFGGDLRASCCLVQKWSCSLSLEEPLSLSHPFVFANRATCAPSTIAYQGDSRPADVSNGGTKRTNLLIRGLLMNWQLHKAAVRSGQLLLIAPPATDYTLDLFWIQWL